MTRGTSRSIFPHEIILDPVFKMDEVELLRQKLAQLEVEKARAEARAEEEKARAEEEKARAEAEKARAEEEKARAETEKARADGLDNLLKAQEMSLKAYSFAGLVV